MREDSIVALRRSLFQYGLSVCVVLLAFLVRELLQRQIGSALPPYLTFYPIVMIVAVAGGFRSGLVATLTAMLLTTMWILPPVGRFVIDKASDQVGLVLFVFSSVLVCVFAELFRRTRVRAAVYKKELALRESEQRYRSLVELSPEAVVVQQDGVIVYANAAALRIYGAESHAELQGRIVMDLIPADDRETIRKRFEAASSGIQAELRETRVVRLDGSEVIVEATSGGIDWYGKGAVQTILRNVTERKRAEAALIQSEKLATVGRMAASIAHEINNPLAAAMNTLFIARNTPGVPPTVLQYLEVADEELKRISYITRQVLGFYRESGTLTRVPVSEIMDSALDLLQSRIKAKHTTIQKDYRAALDVTATRGELRQVFSNLLANSLDSIPDHGTIRIRVSGGHCLPNGGLGVRVTVGDNGLGIRKDIRKLIFEALFTTKDATGTGLGLWVSRQLIEKHGGLIRFRSSVGGKKTGTVFSVVLPAEEGSQNAASAQAP
jgi:PAS domain S-box-containing protein